MPRHDFPVIFVTRRLEDEVFVGEALDFPELAVVHASEGKLGELLRGLVRALVEQSPPIDVHRRVAGAGASPRVGTLAVTIQPPRETPGWREPVTIELGVLRWRQRDEASIARVPALDIEVVAARDEQVDELLPRHVRMALARTKVAERLFDLAMLARVEETTTTEAATVGAEVKTPAQIAADADKEEAAPKRVIEDVGAVMKDDAVPPAYEADGVVDLLADALAGRAPRSVLLVGPSGAGKTAAFGELFRQRRERGLGDAPFWVTSGARLIAGMTGFGLWQERCQLLCWQAKEAGAILHLGNLVELMEVGKAGGSGFGIASFFRPYLSRGDVLAVAECTPEQLPVIERDAPQLLAAFQQIRVEEPPPGAVRKMLRAAAGEFAAANPRLFHGDARGPGPAVVTDAALDVLDRLHRRYATYSAAPGRPLRFLRNLMLDHFGTGDARYPVTARAVAISPTDVTAAFARETGLPLFLLDEGTPLDLAEARGRFARRVIGQAGAVDLVTDLLATVKAALNRPRRPIASLLFVGPTGVGKTEMAKALAEYFFGDTKGDRLARFDMSEYATPGAVGRLVGTAWEAEGLLTAKVREQPFCVVLLDEFEKADPSFFDLLLQVLGEGRLTDSAGRLADFSNAIVVMTSNLGAESFGAGPFGLAKSAGIAADAVAHFTEVVRGFLRPELFNRIDRVVPFLPLDQETIERIAAREVELILKRDGVRQRDLRLDVGPEALRHLARGGYEPLYGARPLKRKVERDLLAPVADAVNQYGEGTALVAAVTLNEAGALQVEVRARTGRPRGDVASGVGTLARQAADLRRRAQAIARSPAALGVQNELFQLRRVLARAEAKPGRYRVDAAQRERHKRLTAIADMVTSVADGATAAEEALVLHLYEDTPLPGDASQIERQLAGLGERGRRVLLELFAVAHAEPHAFMLAFYGSNAADTFKLARAYREVALRGGEGAAVGVSYYARVGKAGAQRYNVDAEDAERFLAEPRGGLLGIVLAIRAPFARARFEAEGGLHVMEQEKGSNPRPIWVDASPVSGVEYRPPKDVEFRFAAVGQRRRTYLMEREELEDAATGRTFRREGTLADAILAAVEENLAKRVEAILSGSP